MDVPTIDLRTSCTNGTTYKQQKELRTEAWIDSINFDDDASSTVSSSVVDSEDQNFDGSIASSFLSEDEDHDFDFKTLSLEDNSDKEKIYSRNVRRNKGGDVLQHILSRNSNVQTVGNVHIENSSQVHIGNVTYINGPIHISNPDKRCLKILLGNNNTAVHSETPPSSSRKTKQSPKKDENPQQAKSNTDDAFLGNIKRKVADNVLRVIERRQWLAQKPMEEYELITEPVEYVIVSHSATEMFTTQAENIYIIRNIQCFHIESCRWDDIGYNFMIGGDGSVYQGRGWGIVGAHTKGYNRISMGICFIGCFMRELPPEISLRACQKIIQQGIDDGYIRPDYKLIGHCQCSPTESPGRKLYEELQTWEHYSEDI